MTPDEATISIARSLVDIAEALVAAGDAQRFEHLRSCPTVSEQLRLPHPDEARVVVAKFARGISKHVPHLAGEIETLLAPLAAPPASAK